MGNIAMHSITNIGFDPRYRRGTRVVVDFPSKEAAETFVSSIKANLPEKEPQEPKTVEREVVEAQHSRELGA